MDHASSVEHDLQVRHMLLQLPMSSLSRSRASPSERCTRTFSKHQVHASVDSQDLGAIRARAWLGHLADAIHVRHMHRRLQALQGHGGCHELSGVHGTALARGSHLQRCHGVSAASSAASLMMISIF